MMRHHASDDEAMALKYTEVQKKWDKLVMPIFSVSIDQLSLGEMLYCAYRSHCLIHTFSCYWEI